MSKNNLSAHGGLWMDGTQLFSTNKELMQGSSHLVQAISYTSALVFNTTNINRAGLTYIYPADKAKTPTSCRAELTMDNPFPGCQKTIYFDPASTNNMVDIKLTGTGIFGTTDWSTKLATKVRYIHFSSAINSVQSIDLQGLSTSIWAVKNANPGSTDIAMWGAATGIRTSTTPRSA